MRDRKIIKSAEICWKRDGCDGCWYQGRKKCIHQMWHDMIKLAKRQKKQINQQKDRIEDFEALNMLRNKRVYYRRFIEEVWKKEHGELSEPDFDEIYKRYFEQQEEIKILKQSRANIFEIMEAVERGRAKGIKELRGEIVEQLEDLEYKYQCEKRYPKAGAIMMAIEIVKGVQNE